MKLATAKQTPHSALALRRDGSKEQPPHLLCMVVLCCLVQRLLHLRHLQLQLLVLMLQVTHLAGQEAAAQGSSNRKQ
jgi:hypothetical protein